MKTIYIVKSITKNSKNTDTLGDEEVIEGVYKSEELALKKIEKMHDLYRTFQLNNPYSNYSQICFIEEHDIIKS